MKRKLAVGLVALALGMALLAAAMGEPQDMQILDGNGEPWLAFTLQEGMECLPSPLQQAPAVPQGLEALYKWMQPREGGRDTWFFRMPHGRVLASASRTEVDTELGGQELLDLWPHIVAVLGRSTAFVDDSPENASLQTLKGEQWLSLQTKAALDGAKMLSVAVEGLARCVDGSLVEVWIAAPAPATYRYDDAAYRELEEDRSTAERWLKSLTLP